MDTVLSEISEEIGVPGGGRSLKIAVPGGVAGDPPLAHGGKVWFLVLRRWFAAETQSGW